MTDSDRDIMLQIEESYTSQLVRASRATTFGDLPGSAVHAAKRLILDTIGCMIGAADLPSEQIVTALFQGFGGATEATVFTTGRKLPAPFAAYVNGHAANALDAEETTLLTGHLSAALVAPALAVAERRASSGQALIAAVTTGFEVAARVALAMQNNMKVDEAGALEMSPLHGHSWTTFGGTAAAARLPDLDHDQTLDAYGITGSNAPLPSSGHANSLPLPRPMSKYSMYGTFAELAVMSGLLAEAGFTCDRAIFDGDDGFWRMIAASGCDYGRLTGGWGQRWLVEDASFKLYPCCRFAHPALDMVLALQRAHNLPPDEIEAIDIDMPRPAFSLRMHRRNVETAVDSQFDVAYQVATALLGEVPIGPAWHSAEARGNPRAAALADRVRMHPAPDGDRMAVEQIRATGRPLRFPWKVTIRAGGTELVEKRQTADGDPWADAGYDDDTLIRKFNTYTEAYLPRATADAIIDVVLTLETRNRLVFPEMAIRRA